MRYFLILLITYVNAFAQGHLINVTNESSETQFVTLFARFNNEGSDNQPTTWTEVSGATVTAGQTGAINAGDEWSYYQSEGYTQYGFAVWDDGTSSFTTHSAAYAVPFDADTFSLRDVEGTLFLYTQTEWAAMQSVPPTTFDDLETGLASERIPVLVKAVALGFFVIASIVTARVLIAWLRRTK